MIYSYCRHNSRSGCRFVNFWGLMQAEYIERRDFIRLIQRIPETYRVALLLSLESGMRIGDVLSMTYGQALFGQPVKEKKTGKMVVFTCPEYARTILYQRFSGSGTIKGMDDLVFESPRKPGKPVHRSTVYRRLRAAARGVEAHVTPHTARKIFAVEEFRKTGSLSEVREALRHDNAATTALYAFSDRMPGKR